jgi:type IV pilus assembly protein PilB
LAKVKSIVGHLFEKGIITLQDANKVRVEQSKTRKTEKELLLAMNMATEEQIVKAQSEMFNIPFVDLTQVMIPDELLAGLNVDSLRNLNLVPFHMDGVQIKVAMLNPFDIQAIQSLKVHFKGSYTFNIYITTSASLNNVMERFMGQAISTEVSRALEDVEIQITDLDTEETDSLDNATLLNAPVARIINSILKYAIKTSSSDIHIEPLEDRVRVRYRVHGVMAEKLSLPPMTASSLVARIKILSDLKIDEKRIPQDGRIQIKSEGKKVDVRVSTLPTIYGEKAVLRLLDVSEGIPQLETSGLRGKAFDSFMDSIKVSSGIILITGPTGSGKTRTLAGALSKLNKASVNIITLENPVEIRIPGVNQVQISPGVGLTFANGLRSILRQDPDIIMVGEIRDEETAKLSVEASLTGHLVLATLHTNSSAAAMPRLLEMGVESYLLASSLKCVVAQRLPRTICRNCIESYPVTEPVMQDINAVLSPIKGFDLISYADNLCKTGPSDGSDFKYACPIDNEKGEKVIHLYRGKGCQQCENTGYAGRTGIFEVFKITQEVEPMILNNALASDIEAVGVKNGMLTMMQDGYLKALEGITTLEEVLRVSRD